MTRAKSMYVRLWSIKTKKLQVHGTPCKCCSRSQQRSNPGLRLRLTALLALIERVWWVSHSLITSSALDIWQSTFNTPTCGRRSCGPARYFALFCQAVLYFQAVSCKSFFCGRCNTGDTTYIYIFLIKNWKTSAVSTTDGWLKLNFASCVTRQTRSLGVLGLSSNWNAVFVTYISTIWLLILKEVPQVLW